MARTLNMPVPVRASVECFFARIRCSVVFGPLQTAFGGGHRQRVTSASTAKRLVFALFVPATARFNDVDILRSAVRVARTTSC